MPRLRAPEVKKEREREKKEEEEERGKFLSEEIGLIIRSTGSRCQKRLNLP